MDNNVKRTSKGTAALSVTLAKSVKSKSILHAVKCPSWQIYCMIPSDIIRAIINTDASTCMQHFTVVVAWRGASFSYFV